MVDTTGAQGHVVHQAMTLSVISCLGVVAGRFFVAHTSSILRMQRRGALQRLRGNTPASNQVGAIWA